MESILEQNSQGIETLYGSSNVRNKKLRGIKEVAEFICKDGQYGDLTIKRKDGRLFLRTNGIYVREIFDFDYAEKLFKILVPMQREVAKEGGEEKMNEFEKMQRMAERYKAEYPPGTRVVLHHMEDPYAPVESGTRGTVKHVDDAGQLHMQWDNGRTLALVPGEDSFRKLTAEELAEEQGQVLDEEVVDTPVQSM